MSLQNSVESINFIRPASVPGSELLIGKNSSRLWRVFHETYTFCACTQAAAGWRYRNKEFFLGDRSSMFMEPGETHCNTAVYKPADFKVLMIQPALVTDAAKELGLSMTPHLHNPDSNDPQLFLTLYRFCAAVETGASLLEQQTLFTACVRILLERSEQRPPSPGGMNAHRAVARIKCYLQDRFAEPVSLDELVALTGLSRFHLVRTFAKQVGMAPHTYQIHVRIETARALLKAGVPPISVSTDVGFADQSHFTRHFKRYWGTTPSRYAASLRL